MLGEIAPYLVITNASFANEGNYTVVIRNPFGTLISVNAPLVIVRPPVILTQPASQFVNTFDSATFSVGVSNLTGASYQWRFNGMDIPGATGAGYSVTDIQAAMAGGYDVVIANAAASVTSGVSYLSVLIPPVILARALQREP